MNVKSASKLYTPRKINGVAFDGTKDITIPVSGDYLPLIGGTLSGDLSIQKINPSFRLINSQPIGVRAPELWNGISMEISSGVFNMNAIDTVNSLTKPIFEFNMYNYTLDFSNVALKFNRLEGDLDGNASTASKLQKSVKINNVPFDGSEDITIPVPKKTSELQNDSGYLTNIPTATNTTLGGIKVGAGLSISNGVLSVDIDKIIADKILEDNKKKYPVGKIIMSATNTNPSTYLGFGTWKLWGSGRVPVGVDTGQTEFNSSEKEGGEKTHTLNVTEIPTHSHMVEGQTSLDGSHQHRIPFNLDDKENPGDIDYFDYGGFGRGSYYILTQPDGGAHSHSMRFVSQNTGGGKAHNNLQPYITCYMWKRTA